MDNCGKVEHQCLQTKSFESLPCVILTHMADETSSLKHLHQVDTGRDNSDLKTGWWHEEGKKNTTGWGFNGHSCCLCLAVTSSCFVLPMGMQCCLSHTLPSCLSMLLKFPLTTPFWGPLLDFFFFFFCNVYFRLLQMLLLFSVTKHKCIKLYFKSSNIRYCPEIYEHIQIMQQLSRLSLSYLWFFFHESNMVHNMPQVCNCPSVPSNVCQSYSSALTRQQPSEW